MKTKEILILVLLFVAGFYMAEFFVDHLVLHSPVQRFIARIGFQLQFYGLIYLLFDTRDMSRKIKNIEHYISEEESKENDS
ncbi:MAG: hypothetical protein JXB48_06080 [Candidatus Latescibacteria bacterium]|nr:hypothetical protein [Candidatus Latescibacterota bacterium]